MKIGYTYIISNKNRTTFYIGVTSDIEGRIFQHKMGEGSKFASRYNLTDLVYYEELDTIDLAINREKQLKRWNRQWKINLIKEDNPDMKDLAADWFTSDELEFNKKLIRKLKEPKRK